MRCLSAVVCVLALACGGCASGVTRQAGADAPHRLAADQKVASATLTVTQGVKASLDDNIKFNPDVLQDMVNRRLELNGLKAEKASLLIEIVIKDVRIRSTAAAIIFGFMAGDDRIVGDVYLKSASGRILDRFEVSASYALGGWAGGQDGMRMSWLYEEFSKVLVDELKGRDVAAGNQSPAPGANAAAAPAPAAPGVPAGPRTPVTGSALLDLSRALGKVSPTLPSQVHSMEFQPDGVVVVNFANSSKRGLYKTSSGGDRLCLSFTVLQWEQGRTIDYLNDCFNVYRVTDGHFVMRAANSDFELQYRKSGTLDDAAPIANAVPARQSPPAPILAEGNFVHASSGLIFPATVADFYRKSVHKHDANGDDVSASYEMPNAPMLATVYVYPASKLMNLMATQQTVLAGKAVLCLAEFNKGKQGVTALSPGAKLIEEKPVALTAGGTPRSGRMAIYEMADSDRALESRLYLFCSAGHGSSDDWLVKYRITYPKTLNANKIIDDFMLAAPWKMAAN